MILLDRSFGRPPIVPSFSTFLSASVLFVYSCSSSIKASKPQFLSSCYHNIKGRLLCLSTALPRSAKAFLVPAGILQLLAGNLEQFRHRRARLAQNRQGFTTFRGFTAFGTLLDLRVKGLGVGIGGLCGFARLQHSKKAKQTGQLVLQRHRLVLDLDTDVLEHKQPRQDPTPLITCHRCFTQSVTAHMQPHGMANAMKIDQKVGSLVQASCSLTETTNPS